MTLVSRLVFFKAESNTAKRSSGTIVLSEISIIIPVKDNQTGVDTYLRTFFETQQQHCYPREIIIVDNNSIKPISIAGWEKCTEVPVKLYKCTKPGAGAARNVGAMHASGRWLLFNDSDCLPTKSLLTGYIAADNGSLGYAGNVLSLGSDPISRYYESQEILLPLKVADSTRDFVPQYLITANCLVWREAYLSIGRWSCTLSCPTVP